MEYSAKKEKKLPAERLPSIGQGGHPRSSRDNFGGGMVKRMKEKRKKSAGRPRKKRRKINKGRGVNEISVRGKLR